MGKKKRGKAGICVYCGQEDRLTADHIPPRNLFPHPRPNNLITIPCCSHCNREASKDDEYFQTVIIMRDEIAEHHAAARVLPNVLRGLRRPVGLRRRFLANIRRAEMRTPSGLYLGDMDVYNVDSVRVERVATRIIKGLFYYETGKRLPDEYEAITYIVSKFKVPWDEELRNQLLELVDFTQSQPLKTIGDGVFSYRFCVCDDDNNTIVWMLVFYEIVTFVGLTMPKSSE